MIEQKFKIEDLNINLKYNLGYSSYIFCYIHSNSIFEIENCNNLVLIFISNNDWESDFTPFNHKAVFKNGRDFTGKANEYLERFKESIKKIEETLTLNVEYRILAGYSLAGLFSLYATKNNGLFRKICSVSPSFWYPGFVDFVKENDFNFDQAYFSIGNKEFLTKNPYLSKSYDCLKEITDILKNRNKNIYFEMNEGGHFNNPDERLKKCIVYLLTN